jgi:hypothetical protein
VSISHHTGRSWSSFLTQSPRALLSEHVPVTVLRLVAQGDDHPSPPDEEADQALEDDERQHPLLASVPPRR